MLPPADLAAGHSYPALAGVWLLARELKILGQPEEVSITKRQVRGMH